MPAPTIMRRTDGDTPTVLPPNGIKAPGPCGEACSTSQRSPTAQILTRRFSQFQLDGEIERRYELWNRPGKIAVTGFLTRAKLGTYQDAITLAQATGAPADIAAVRQYRSRSGLSMNLEQEVIDDLGVFARAGFASGDVEPDSYTDIDRTVAAGLSLTGKRWGRPDDTFGFAAIANAITPIHAAISQ